MRASAGTAASVGTSAAPAGVQRHKHNWVDMRRRFWARRLPQPSGQTRRQTACGSASTFVGQIEQLLAASAGCRRRYCCRYSRTGRGGTGAISGTGAIFKAKGKCPHSHQEPELPLHAWWLRRGQVRIQLQLGQIDHPLGRFELDRPAWSVHCDAFESVWS